MTPGAGGLYFGPNNLKQTVLRHMQFINLLKIVKATLDSSSNKVMKNTSTAIFMVYRLYISSPTHVYQSAI